jgi:PPOX class probable F420-dependent enzyme
MSFGEKAVELADHVYHRIRHPDALSAARGGAGAEGFDGLRGHKYCLLVSFKRSGEPVPTPVWFGLDGQGHALIRTEAGAAKVRRIRANAHVRLAPATARGKPVGPLADGTARELPAPEHARAEAVLAASYGLGRKLYEGMSGPLGVQTTYLEITPGSYHDEPQSG